MAVRHNHELLMCRKLAGSSIGKLCLNCEDRCVNCDSFVKQQRQVRICDECAFGSVGSKCLICGGVAAAGVAAFYCKECVMLEKDRDGCPRILNLARIDRTFANTQKIDK